MKNSIYIFVVLVAVAFASVPVVCEVLAIDSNATYSIDGSYTFERPTPKPTHTCSVHGKLGGQWYSSDFTTIAIDEVVMYHGCGRCTMEHLATYLKKHIPPITKIVGESK